MSPFILAKKGGSMKGMKVSLDTTVNSNLCDWRKLAKYSKAKDAIIVTSRTYYDICIIVPHAAVGELYTISFEASGSTEGNLITTHWIPLSFDDIIAMSKGGHKFPDNGHVNWYNLSDKVKRYFVVYRCVEKANTIYIRIKNGTIVVRDIKLELSDHPH